MQIPSFFKNSLTFTEVKNCQICPLAFLNNISALNINAHATFCENLSIGTGVIVRKQNKTKKKKKKKKKKNRRSTDV